MTISRDGFFVGGSWRSPAGTDRVDVIGAATEEPVGSIPLAEPADVDAAVTAARSAADGEWADTSAGQRADLLDAFADALEAVRTEVATTVSAQNGMPISLSRFLEGKFPILLLRYYAGLARELSSAELRESAHNRTLVRRVPLGVAAAIVPWNYPVTLAVAKLAPALAAGCAVVLKPSPNTSLDSYLLAEAAQKAGLPDGVVNWVPGGRELGAYLVSHPGVDKVAFTGSTAAGKEIGKVCAELIRPVSLELGGKSAAIVLPDADLNAMAGDFFAATLANNGQTCVSCSRILAPRSRYAEVVDFVASMAGEARIGDPLDKATQVGPMATEEHRRRVEGFIETGKRAGARLVTGGGRPSSVERGWFVEPTVFADVDNDSTIGREEIFGPVFSVIPYEDEQDAVRLANDSRYGLGGSVWSADVEHATEIAKRIRTGTIGVNSYAIDPQAPFGGMKQSGIGREFGPEALGAYQQSQSVYLPLTRDARS